MINKPDTNKIRVARHRRTRKNIMGTAECPRMDVFRSNSHIYVQLIDDAAGRTLVASSTLDPAIRDQVKEMSKVEAAKRYGADICLVKGVYDDAYNRAVELQKESGAVFIHPFDDPDVIAGQGTIGLELLEQLPDMDAVIVPVGGGGLISGVAFAIKSLNPNCKVYGVQAAGAPSMYNSIQHHKKGKLQKAMILLSDRSFQIS